MTSSSWGNFGQASYGAANIGLEVDVEFRPLNDDVSLPFWRPASSEPGEP